MRTPGQVLIDWVIRVVTRPRHRYQRFAYNEPEKLKHHIQKGDILLVDGDQRVSQVIKYLTQSTWSHSAIYVGDELIERDHPLKPRLLHRYGREAQHMIIEALVEQGVIASPLLKYIDFNVRLCRPFRLRQEDLRKVIDFSIEQLGEQYDVRNMLDLARYLMPVHLIPAGLRDEVLHFGSGKPTEVICSSFIAEAFRRVGFPILREVPRQRRPRPFKERVRHAILGRPTKRAWSGLFRARHPTLIVPRDFDLSPYFEIVKFNLIADGTFDYRKIPWETPPPPSADERGA